MIAARPGNRAGQGIFYLGQKWVGKLPKPAFVSHQWFLPSVLLFWLAGNHNKRFKAFIAHDGIFNFESMYLETEEMWFVHWDMGGAYWEKNNKVAQNSYANSPHKFVDKWDTPIMVIHGAKDYRILDSQGMSAFNAAIIRDVPAKLLYFPEENHWVLSPQNGILWQREFFKWLDKWLK